MTTTSRDSYPVLTTKIDQHQGTHNGLGIYEYHDVRTDLSPYADRRWDDLSAEDRAWWESTTADYHAAMVELESLSADVRERAKEILMADESTDLEDSAGVVRRAIAEARGDEDAAILAASDVEGWFGIVGRPGEQLHTFDWFATEHEAQAWCEATHDAIRANNPRLGRLECQSLATADALDIKYLDGTRVYFRHRESGQGFLPRYSSR